MSQRIVVISPEVSTLTPEVVDAVVSFLVATRTRTTRTDRAGNCAMNLEISGRWRRYRNLKSQEIPTNLGKELQSRIEKLQVGVGRDKLLNRVQPLGIFASPACLLSGSCICSVFSA